jgi:hypothetical protein
VVAFGSLPRALRASRSPAILFSIVLMRSENDLSTCSALAAPISRASLTKSAAIALAARAADAALDVVA